MRYGVLVYAQKNPGAHEHRYRIEWYAGTDAPSCTVEYVLNDIVSIDLSRSNPMVQLYRQLENKVRDGTPAGELRWSQCEIYLQRLLLK